MLFLKLQNLTFSNFQNLLFSRTFIPGQEDDTIDKDGEIKITPFNLREENEDGHFAKDGSFIWNKKKEGEDSDVWLENIDWGKVWSSRIDIKSSTFEKNSRMSLN